MDSTSIRQKEKKMNKLLKKLSFEAVLMKAKEMRFTDEKIIEELEITREHYVKLRKGDLPFTNELRKRFLALIGITPNGYVSRAFNKVLRIAMKQYTKKQLADGIGTNYNGFVAMTNGRSTPSANMLFALADFMDMELIVRDKYGNEIVDLINL